MSGYVDKKKIVADTTEWIGDFKDGYWVTLNGRTGDHLRFEQALNKFAMWLNEFCYGREYQRNSKKLKIVAGIETGKINGDAHSHLVITHPGDIDRTFDEIADFVRKRWYRLIYAKGSLVGNMVDVQPIGNVESRIRYAIKDSRSFRDDGFNVVFI